MSLLPRVTMQQVAAAAGVHQTTVSLALRNDPRLPAKTRRRLLRIAEELGYRPDPMLAALNYYRSGRRPVQAATTIAFVVNFRDREEMAASRPHGQFLEGARKHAEQIGYQLETFYVGHKATSAGPRLERVLRARGIAGVIIGAFGDKMIEFSMDWAQFSVVLIESQQLGQPLHMVSCHQMMITREAVQRLRALGYRRIGLAVGEREEVYLKNAFTAGYFVELGLHPELVNLPPLLIPPTATAAEIAAAIAPWVEKHEIEVIATNWAEVSGALRASGWHLPEEVVVASLDLNPDIGPNAGMEQPHAIVGGRAVEQLAILIRTNQRGFAIPHNSTLIGGRWIDGSDVPGCPKARRRRRAG